MRCDHETTCQVFPSRWVVIWQENVIKEQFKEDISDIKSWLDPTIRDPDLRFSAFLLQRTQLWWLKWSSRSSLISYFVEDFSILLAWCWIVLIPSRERWHKYIMVRLPAKETALASCSSLQQLISAYASQTSSSVKTKLTVAFARSQRFLLILPGVTSDASLPWNLFWLSPQIAWFAEDLRTGGVAVRRKLPPLVFKEFASLGFVVSAMDSVVDGAARSSDDVALAWASELSLGSIRLVAFLPLFLLRAWLKHCVWGTSWAVSQLPNWITWACCCIQIKPEAGHFLSRKKLKLAHRSWKEFSRIMH